MTEYHVLGVMSGSSLDGLDVCLTKFNQSSSWAYEILAADTLDIPEALKLQLRQSDRLKARSLFLLDQQYGNWMGEQIRHWRSKNKHKVDLIGVHGHTVFHEPKEGFSIQIGNGANVCVATGIPTVDRFREKDIILGGQGAPLVPFGERLLWPQYQVFINLGGIANVATHGSTTRAWDIAPCNQVLNHLAKLAGKDYDENGQIAREGALDPQWLENLRSLDYFSKPAPKSLSNQWTQEVLHQAPNNIKDALNTYVHFLGEQIAADLKAVPDGQVVLITGGGAYNSYLIETIKKMSPGLQFVLPEHQLIAYKEALVFGLMALHRQLELPNVLSSVTGALRDSVSGVLHLPE